MKLGAYTACLHDRPLAEALAVLREPGLDSAEISSGGFLPAPHLPITAVRSSHDAREEYLGRFAAGRIELTALRRSSTGSTGCATPRGSCLRFRSRLTCRHRRP